MAEALVRLTNTKSSSFDRKNVNTYGLAFDEIRLEEIQEEGQDLERQRKDKTDAFCDVCLMHNLIALSKNVAFYLCYLCEQYLCDKCFKGHESHKYINLVREKSERDGQIDSLCDEIQNESEREDKFEREKVSMVDRVNVKYGSDNKECWITGLCGLNNKRWVVSDYSNYCIQIFNVGSNLLQRYIRLGPKPWDVTEIKVKSEHSEEGVMSSDISVMNRAEPLQSLIAVTIPGEHIILVIDVTQNPAAITNTLKTEKQCRSIDFSGDNIFTVCNDGESDDGSWFVSVMSTDGVTIKTIKTDLHIWSFPSLAVCRGRFYITDPLNHNVLCLNDEGKVVSHKTIEGSWPEGISVDTDTNQVYICTLGNDTLYRLDSRLEGLENLFNFKSVDSEWPYALCLYRDKLYISHHRLRSTHKNCVTVVRVL